MKRIAKAGVRILFAAAVALVVSGPAASAKDARAPWDTGAAKPSPNAGKRGAYEVKCAKHDYFYSVYVPKSYSDDNPAGILIFFHGQGKPSRGLGFGSWATRFCEPYNLIGIKMKYMDGDNTKDTGGKVDAAEMAIAQTAADYKVIIGRGTSGSFSGGGLPHSKLYGRRGKLKDAARGRWPFNHMGLYGSNFWTSSAGGRPMSWFVGLGGKEWPMGTPSLGSTQPRRWLDVAMEAVKKGGCPDAYLRIEPEKGHSISGEDIASSAGQFPRSDIAFGAFIYEPDFEEARIAPIVKAANKHALGQALRAIDRLLKSSSTKDELRTKAEAVKAKIDARIEAAVALTRGLADKDPVLCEFYGRQFMVQLSGHPKQKDVRSILMGNRRKQPYMLALRVWPMFVEKFRGFFGGGPKLNKEAVGFLEQVKTAASESSLLGRMTREFLVMKPPENE